MDELNAPFTTLLWMGFGVQVVSLILLGVVIRRGYVNGIRNWEEILENRRPAVGVIFVLMIVGTVLRIMG